MHALLDWLMHWSTEAEPTDSLEAWWENHVELAKTFPTAIELATAGGFIADRLGYAFASGYQAAGTAMFGADPSAPRPCAFCATENGSAHPSAIETKLESTRDGYQLDGEKSFVTFGTFARRLFIVASEGRDGDGRNRLRVVEISVRKGVTVKPLPPGPFVPEIPHASVRLDAVVVKPVEVLDGDGYTRFLKPFRTVEDIHVHGALLGYLLRISRAAWPNEITEQLLACITTVVGLASVAPTAVAGHVALGGTMARVRELLERIEPLWSEVSDAERQRWERDRALLKVAGKARAKRLEAAWRHLDKSQ